MSQQKAKVAEIQVISLRDRAPDGAQVINCTSRGPVPFNQLSPFYVGRGMRLYRDFTAQNVENAWQYCKVYPCHAGSDGAPSEAYFDWARAGWANSRAERYPMGKGAKPLYSYWDGEALDYIAARQRIYIPLYACEVVKTAAYGVLNMKYRDRDSFVLQDFDAYDHLRLGYSAADIINDSARTMGHGFVIKFLLEGIVTVSRNGTVTLPEVLMAPPDSGEAEEKVKPLSLFGSKERGFVWKSTKSKAWMEQKIYCPLPDLDVCTSS